MLGSRASTCGAGNTICLETAHISTLLLEFDHPAGDQGCPRGIAVLAPLIQREILYRLLMGERGGQLRQIACVGSHSQRIAKAVGWLKNNFDRALSIEALASEVSMSISALQPPFQGGQRHEPPAVPEAVASAGGSPVDAGEGFDAATAGSQVGYESPSQFSWGYSRLFGLPPKRDLLSLRVRAAEASV